MCEGSTRRGRADHKFLRSLRPSSTTAGFPVSSDRRRPLRGKTELSRGVTEIRVGPVRCDGALSSQQNADGISHWRSILGVSRDLTAPRTQPLSLFSLAGCVSNRNVPATQNVHREVYPSCVFAPYLFTETSSFRVQAKDKKLKDKSSPHGARRWRISK